MKTQELLAQANSRLRNARVGVAIESRGNRLYLRATLPPRPDSIKSRPYQQRIALATRANESGISIAEAEARKVGALLNCQIFSWEPYWKPKQLPVLTSGDWIARFEQHYFERRARNPKSETTWKGDYWAVLRRRPPDQPLTPELLQAAIIKTPPDTKTRKRFCMVLQALANFAELNTNFKAMAGSYSPKRVTPRDLPDDQLIAVWRSEIKNDAWRWAYGAIATYGLRPHEIFFLDVHDLAAGGYILSVLDGGKTGARRVWPCYPEWIDTFELRAPQIPVANGKTNSNLGERCAQYFRRAGMPFQLYDLRHCWAIRSLEFGLDISLAAQQMGHSLQVHTDLYHHWISDRQHQRAFDALMMRPDRLQASSIVH